MCSFSKETFDIIHKLEHCLSSEVFNLLCVGGFKFFTVSKGHKVSDYICYASNRQCALPTLDVFETKLFEIMPWIKDFIKVNVAPHGFGISLSRSSCFLYGLKDVELLGKEYGCNSMFSNKVFICSMVEMKDQGNSLTNLRLKLTKELLQNIICACGGTFGECSNDNKQTVKFDVTNKNIIVNGITNVIVGPVRSDYPLLTLDLYKCLRLEDITSLCEHKLDDINITEEKDNIFVASMVFDLLQSSIQRTVTLHLHEKDIDKRTSCKGTVFVLYNYARLYSLCARFYDEVSAGIYPNLPELENIDFSLLSSDEEWLIMFESILYWPTILKKSIIDINSGRPKIHLIFDFLKKIATNFSLYYHRIKVLTEPRNHLLPVLFARIWLLKSLLQIYQNAFKLIEAEHGYASTLPPDDLRVIKRPKTKKSQGSRTTHNELEKNRQYMFNGFINGLQRGRLFKNWSQTRVC